MNKLIDAVRTFLSGVEYFEQEENANYVVTKEDKELLKEAIDTVLTHCEQKTYTDKDMEEFAEWLIGRSADWITDEERCETAETFIEMWEKER